MLMAIERAAVSYEPGSHVEQLMRKSHVSRGDLLNAQLADTLSQNIRTAIDVSPLIPASMREVYEADLQKSVEKLLPTLYNETRSAILRDTTEQQTASLIFDTVADRLPFVTIALYEERFETYLALLESGTKRLRFKTSGEGTPCDLCAEQNGKVFTLDELVAQGLVPPLHPNCRCRVVEGESERSIVATETMVYRAQHIDPLETLIRFQEAQKRASSRNNNVDYNNITPERLALGLGILRGEIYPERGNKSIPNELYAELDIFTDPLKGFSATERIEIYIAFGRESNSIATKVLAAANILLSEPEKFFESIASMYKRQAVITGVTDSNLIYAYGNVMGGYLSGVIVGQIVKGVEGLKSARSTTIVERSDSIISVDDVSYRQSSIDKAFSKHSGDFGVYPDGSKASVELFKNDLNNLLETGVQKSGTWYGNQGTHVYNPTTKQWAFYNADGSFNTAFKLSESQLKYLIETGVVR